MVCSALNVKKAWTRMNHTQNYTTILSTSSDIISPTYYSLTFKSKLIRKESLRGIAGKLVHLLLATRFHVISPASL